jgi:predicted PurR-regulated permease PerM
MGLDFPIIWGFIGFTFNFIPTLGPIAASVPPTILAFLQFDNFFWALVTSIFMSAIQFISGNFVEPMILGNRLNLNILAILLSLLLWGFIWGIPGMLLSVPITAALNIVFKNIKKFNDLSEILSK